MRPLPPSGFDPNDGSAFWDLPIILAKTALVGLMVHKGEEKAARVEVEVSADVTEVWMVGSEATAFQANPDLKDVPAGSITKQAAIWANSDTIAWRHPLEDGPEKPRRFHLHYSQAAKMSISGSGVQGADECFELQPLSSDLPKDMADKFPYLKGCSTLQVPIEAVKKASQLLTGQLLVSMKGPCDEALDATGLQLHGVLDALLTYDGPLGYQHTAGGRSVSVWAPTAQCVQLLRWGQARGGQPEIHAMVDGGRGVWCLQVPAAWDSTYFKYRVTVYCPWTQRIEVSEVTDPYSVSLTADGDRTQFVSITAAELKPQGWDQDASPTIGQWTDISIYELHIRDFSATDTTVPERLRGKYLAFGSQHIGEASGGACLISPEPVLPPTAGLRHLAKLRSSGLNHLHLLPTYDFGSVPEREENQVKIQEDLRDYPPDSEHQQAMVAMVADNDGFNWGYDPVHWGVPEGSYATDPDGGNRIVEFRQMIMALHQAGWRVILDVVYNHVFRSGPHDRYSIIDKLVPGYYLRRMEDGDVCQSACCNNTASENAMCERLMVDNIVLWAKHYKIDGFRFDIMGHLLVSTLEKMRSRLDALTLEKDGVDGRSIYIYGEAWDFGEMVNNQRGVNCSQRNLAGTGLGSFNDRLRDGALGGGPFDPFYTQGLVTGLGLACNGYGSHGNGDPASQIEELLKVSDWIRYGLAGNLREFQLKCADGVVRDGQTSKIHGLPLAYGALPHEHVAFIGCHDNLTIFDSVTEKAPLTAMAEDRTRDDLLRSKSLDRDSYNSGDHFNRIDWTGNDNNFGVGLPSASKNHHGWHYKRKLLANPLIKPKPEHIQLATDIFQLMLRIRYSSPLFRMAKPEDILRQVSFPGSGPDQIPGAIVMELTSSDQLQGNSDGILDPNFKRLVVVFNCSPTTQALPPPQGAGILTLHPFQSGFKQDDKVSGCVIEERLLIVPARTTAIFVELR